MEQDFLGRVRLGDAAQANRCVVLALLGLGRQNDVAAVDLRQLFQQRPRCVAKTSAIPRAECTKESRDRRLFASSAAAEFPLHRLAGENEPTPLDLRFIHGPKATAPSPEVRNLG